MAATPDGIPSPSAAQEQRIFEGLQRSPLFGGVPFKVLLMEGALGGTILLMGQFSLPAIGLALLCGGAAHLVMKSLIAGDPLYLEQLRAALLYKGYYTPHAHWDVAPPEERPPIST